MRYVHAAGNRTKKPSGTDADRRTLRGRYRPRRYYLWLGLGTLIFFLVVGAISVAAAWWNLDGSFPHPNAAALIFGVFWTGFSLLSLWVLAAYFRERLRLGPSAVVSRGVCHLRTTRLADVEKIIWRRYPAGGSIVIRTPAKRLTVELANFTRSERDEIIAYFREAIPPSRQEGWETYDSSVRTPRKSSRGAELLLIIVLSSFATFFVAAGIRQAEPGHILLGLLNAAVAVGLLFLRRPSNPSSCHHL